MVFGDDFSGGEPWEVIRTKLGFGGAVGRDELFECLSACAYSTGLPFVIFIDALDESPNAARWKDKLPEFLAQLDCIPNFWSVFPHETRIATWLWMLAFRGSPSNIADLTVGRSKR
ncbi:hypothetical protein EOS_26135 [Caballeronia mineralivorans PML1(12)]|uniref:Uncharacterized protein n=1 Tax=Caballeronia mineralivorans PML1(12) TaxID=908627 RepID=A0A0J1CSK8_9BURK|nr:hypothetical protein EOS_26135 [Caballeronia mineralivorans PML1(12)]